SSARFGLIIPGQQQKKPTAPQRPTPAARPSVFDESSNSAASEDDAPQLGAMRKTGVVSGPSLMERRVARNMQAKALAEDPTIFQYDELYDDMDSKREQAKETKKQEPRKAKYINRLMEQAERRKLENELRIERQVQKDREAEGEKFKDKDTYVTAAYRKKLESIRQLQEQDERDEYLEAIGDVTKQKDLDGFYRHLYEQKLGSQKAVLKPTPDTSSCSTKQRSYRKRRESVEEEQPEAAAKSAGSEETKAHLSNNIDADSDFSIDESSDDEEKPKAKEEHPKTSVPSENAKPKTKSSDGAATEEKTKQNQQEETTGNSNGNAKEPEQEEGNESELITEVGPPVDRSQIWRKRTVGDVFDAALARYHQRKLARRA
ncbi:hypothetical protein KR093_004636, partial [Drosophila rubida]